ncbi:MAG: plasmid recombination protein [Christensenella sp.]|nr:plasmid recombination protein [Christensenella sp.]
MVGKGSVNHNSRQFHAKNTDPTRAHLNHDYCNEKIKAVFHELFDDALEKYNAKQTRADRRIDDYYEKIRSGKQEKPFHEVILQVGNRDDMNAQTEDGALAAKVLDEYMQSFQAHNPNLRVFSAHLHMDEATPHLHIDFVPFTTGSKRGLETRLSLKQALAAQGFIGGSRGDTEWSQWVLSEKEQLAAVMERHGIEWEQKGTHEKHLSVLDYEKKVRSEEVLALDGAISEKQVALHGAADALREVKGELTTFVRMKELIENETWKYDQPEWSLPDPPMLMTAKAYRDKFAHLLLVKIKQALKTAVSRYHALVGKLSGLQKALDKADNAVYNLTERIRDEQERSKLLETEVKEYRQVQKYLGPDKAQDLIQRALADLETHKRLRRKREEYER